MQDQDHRNPRFDSADQIRLLADLVPEGVPQEHGGMPGWPQAEVLAQAQAFLNHEHPRGIAAVLAAGGKRAAASLLQIAMLVQPAAVDPAIREGRAVG